SPSTGRGMSDDARDVLLNSPYRLTRTRDSQSTVEHRMPVAVGHTLHFPEDSFDSGPWIRSISSGMHARSASECSNAQTRIVGEREFIQEPALMPGLQVCIFEKVLARFSMDGVLEGIGSSDHPASSPTAARISMTLPALVVAITRRGMSCSGL